MFARLALAQKWSRSQSPSNDALPFKKMKNGDEKSGGSKRRNRVNECAVGRRITLPLWKADKLRREKATYDPDFTPQIWEVAAAAQA